MKQIHLEFKDIKITIDEIMKKDEIVYFLKKNQSPCNTDEEIQDLFFAHQSVLIPFEEKNVILDNESYKYIQSKLNIENINSYLYSHLEYEIYNAILERFYPDTQK